MFEINNNAYEKRKVRYEHIHSIDPKDFDALVSVIDPKSGDNILDICCGYGAVSQKILDKLKATGTDIRLCLLDNSDLQMSRAKQEVASKISDLQLEFDPHYYQCSSLDTKFPDNHFDTVVNKMGLHEVTQEDQVKMVKEMYRILKPGGKLVIWELALTLNTQPIFQKFIREKDRLAEFESLVVNRHFPQKDEILQLLKNAGFTDYTLAHDVYPTLSVRNRKGEFVSAERMRMEKMGNVDEVKLEELSEKKVNELISFATKLSEDEKNIMNYQEVVTDSGLMDITMNAQKGIFVAIK